jgi:hypothetical protein
VSGGHLGGFTHYWNLHRTEARLDALLARFPFTTMRACLEHGGWLERLGGEGEPAAAVSREGSTGARLDPPTGPA